MTVLAGDYSTVLAGPAFCLGVGCDDEAVHAIDFLPPGTPQCGATTAVARRAEEQLRAYLNDARFTFDLPLQVSGTAFRQRVWRAIAAIPLGQTRSYGELARLLGSAPRAVGQACGDNPLPIVFPCHRVVAATGVGGFAHTREGFLLAAKHWLLAHESRAARS